MSDARGSSGGVSGRNSAGFSEYSDLSCLQQPFSQILPTPTATLTYPMPDYVASVPSLTTSDGVIYTQTVVATVRNGKAAGQRGTDAGVLGASVGVGIAAALGACLVFYILWRRRQKRRELSWDVPDGVASTLGHSGAPIDRKFAQRLQPQANVAGQRRNPVGLAAAGEMPGNRSSRTNSLHSSLHSFGGSAYELRAEYNNAPLDSPTGFYTSPPGTAPLPYSDFSPPSHSYGVGENSFGSQEQEVLSQLSPQQMAAQQRSHYGARRASASSGSMRVGAGGAAAYRSPFGDYSTSGDIGSGQYEEVPMSEPRYPASSAGSGTYGTTGTPTSAAQAYSMARTGSSGSSSSTGNPFSNSRRAPASALGSMPGNSSYASSGAAVAQPRAGYGFVQHSDAGLLLDDSIDDADAEADAARQGIVELPPQYDAVPRREPRQQLQQAASSSSTPSATASSSSVQAAQAPQAPQPQQQPTLAEGEEEDEAEFWRPAPAPSRP